jgi:predicted aspartyl protease
VKKGVAALLVSLSILSQHPVLAIDPSAPDANAPVPAPTDPLASARKLLADDRWEEALVETRRLVAADSTSAGARTLLGDALYRRGDFDEAEEAYRAAVAADPNLAAAHFGVGRILRTNGHYGEAAESFHRAAALDPNNAKYVRILSNHLARREDVLKLLAHYLEMPPAEDEGIIKNVRAWIELLKELGDEPLGEILKSDPTDLPLNVLRGQAYLKADVNGALGQRFAFDTGATGLTVSARLAKQAKLKPIRPFTITGMGGKGTVDGDLVVIKSLTLGGVQIKNVTATIAEPKGEEEGLFGPPVLSSFLVKVDLDPGTLGLRLNEGHTVADANAAATVSLPFRNVGGQIFVRAALNGTMLNAMIDTGASSSLATMSAVPRVPGLELLPEEWLQGKSVGLGGNIPRKAIRAATLSFAGLDFKADGMRCVDLSRFSRALESEIYLVIGFPELAKFTMEIDYRTNTLRLTPKGK